MKAIVVIGAVSDIAQRRVKKELASRGIRETRFAPLMLEQFMMSDHDLRQELIRRDLKQLRSGSRSSAQQLDNLTRVATPEELQVQQQQVAILAVRQLKQIHQDAVAVIYDEATWDEMWLGGYEIMQDLLHSSVFRMERWVAYRIGTVHKV